MAVERWAGLLSREMEDPVKEMAKVQCVAGCGGDRYRDGIGGWEWMLVNAAMRWGCQARAQRGRGKTGGRSVR